MLRSRLFWKLLLTFAALTGVGLATLGATSLQRQHYRALDTATEELHRELQLLLATLPTAQLSSGFSSAEKDNSSRLALQDLVAAAGSAAGDAFSLIDAQGRVVADSRCASLSAVDSLDRLGQRPEVVASLATGRGSDRRGSAVDGREILYAAQIVEGCPGIRVARASRPLHALARRGAADRQAYLLSGVAVLILLASSAAVLVRHVVRPVLSLNEAADAIARGDYQQRAFVPGNDELGVLARSFNRMSQELGSQLVELREGGQRQATVLGGMIEGVIAIDERERVLFANTAAGKLFGFIPPQVEGRPLLEVVRHHTLHQAVAGTLATGRPQRLETDWEGPDRRILLVQVTPLPGDPCPGVVVVIHDTTELRRLESLRQDFVANVSHELKTPLSSIKAYTETLIDGAVNDTDHNMVFLGRIEEQADRLNNLIQDLLALARIESAQQPFDIQPVAVAEIVDACVGDYRKQAEARQITLRSEPPDADSDDGLHVTADAEGLRVIFNNLIDNAIKYTAVGGRVTIGWRKGDRQAVRIEVADSGMGIPAEALPRVFERFYRVDKARSREMGGTGLGLAIVKHLVQAFGGAVSVASREGQGTVFTVELPKA